MQHDALHTKTMLHKVRRASDEVIRDSRPTYFAVTMKNVTVRLSEEKVEELDDEADELDMSRADK